MISPDQPDRWFDRTPLGTSPPTYLFCSVNHLSEGNTVAIVDKLSEHMDRSGAYSLKVRQEHHGFTKTIFEIIAPIPFYRIRARIRRAPRTLIRIEHWYAPGEGRMDCTDFHLYGKAVREQPYIHELIEAALKKAA